MGEKSQGPLCVLNVNLNMSLFILLKRPLSDASASLTHETIRVWRNTFASKQFIKKNINNVNNYFTDQFRWLRTKRYLRF